MVLAYNVQLAIIQVMRSTKNKDNKIRRFKYISILILELYTPYTVTHHAENGKADTLTEMFTVFTHATHVHNTECQKLEVLTGPMYKLLLSFTVISEGYRSFIPNKTTFIKYCLTLDFKPPLEFWNLLSKIVLGKFHGSGKHSKHNCLVYKTEPIFPGLRHGKLS